MANDEQVKILKQGVGVWNRWRIENKVDIDLTGISFWKAYLWQVNFRNANLSEANLSEANLRSASLTGANLSEANLVEADLWGADLRGANLQKAYLSDAHLSGADLSGANLDGATLIRARLVGTKLSNANLSNCRIFGISAWNVNLTDSRQSNLIVTDMRESVITVDNLEIAQFIYLLLHNEKLREVIDTVGKKAVLILGRFTDERLAVLDAIRDELRKRDYIPILFDFEKPSSRDVTETVVTLAHLSRFIIADLTDPRSIPHELATIVPHLRSVAIQPIILKGENPYGMFQDFRSYQWLLPTHEYETEAQLIAELGEKVITPAEAKVDELRQRK